MTAVGKGWTPYGRILKPSVVLAARSAGSGPEIGAARSALKSGPLRYKVVTMFPFRGAAATYANTMGPWSDFKCFSQKLPSARADAIRLRETPKMPTLARVVNRWHMNSDTMGVYTHPGLAGAATPLIAGPRGEQR